MGSEKFLKTTISALDSKLFNELKDTVLDEYLGFVFVDADDITPDVLCEKLYDYFRRTGKTFEKLVEKYTNDLNSVVDDRIIKEEKPRKKGEPVAPPCRARKYYDKAENIKEQNKSTQRGLLDYTRLMLCLYNSIISNKYEQIENFDFSTASLNLNIILDSLKQEKGSLGKKLRFDLNNIDTRCSFIILIIMFFYMKSKTAEEQ